MPVLGPVTQGDPQQQLGAQHGEVEGAMDFFAPCGVPAAASPEVEIPLLVAGPSLVIALGKRQAAGIDVGVGYLFVDERHWAGSPGVVMAGVVASTSRLIIPRW